MRLRSCTEGKQNENDVKQKRDCEAAMKLMTLSQFIPTLRDSFSFCFVTSEVDKSNFYKDLERVMDWKKIQKKNEKQNENEVKQKRE
jgi:hypothetical protein